MAQLRDIKGTDYLADAWKSIENNEIDINNQVVNHVNGTTEKHKAEDIDYTGTATGATNVKQAIDTTYGRIDYLIGQTNIDPNKDPEVIDARVSTVKSKTFDSVDARFEEAESAINENVNKIGNLSNLTTTNKTSLVNATNEIDADLQSHLLDMAKHLLNVKDYGAKGDGITDDTTAFNNALLAASAIGGIAYVPPSNKGYVLAGTVTLPPYSTLMGSAVFPSQSSEAGNWTPIGSTLLFTTTSSTIISSHGTTISGLTFYYPNQTNTNPPIVYPATIQMATEQYICDHRIENCYVVNAYQFITTVKAHARLTIKDIMGWCLYNFATIDDAWDTDHIENITLNPGYWWIFENGDPLSSPSYAFSKANMTGINFGYNCSITVHNYLQTGGLYGFHFYKGTVQTEGTYGMFSNISFDSVVMSLYITDMIGSMGLEFTNLMCVAASNDMIITADDPESIIHITNYESTGCASYNIIHAGNCGLYINNAKIKVSSGSNFAILNTSINNAKSALHISDTYLCGIGSDIVTQIPVGATGVTMDVTFDNCRYIAGGVLPVIAPITGNGTLNMRCLNAPPVGYLTAQLAPAITPVKNTISVPVRVFVTNGATVQTVKINGTVATTLQANASCQFTLGTGDTIAMGTSIDGVTWTSFGL